MTIVSVVLTCVIDPLTSWVWLDRTTDGLEWEWRQSQYTCHFEEPDIPACYRAKAFGFTGLESDYSNVYCHNCHPDDE